MTTGEGSPMGEVNVRITPFAGTDQDLAALTRVRNETLEAASLPEDFRAFTPREMYDYYNQGGYSLERNAWLLLDKGKPAAAAILYPPAAFPDRPPGNFHLYVVPSESRRGYGSRLLDFLSEEAAARGYPVLETTIAAEDAGSTRFLSERGFAVVGHTHHLVRQNVENTPRANLPAGYSLRTLSELGEGLSFYLETANRLGAYDPNYSLIDNEGLQTLAEEGMFQPEGLFFLSGDEGRIVGIIRASFLQDRSRGYLNEIRLEPGSRGKGLGLALVDAALHYLAGQGVSRAELDTAGENMAAYNLAVRAGFEEARHWLHFLKRLPA